MEGGSKPYTLTVKEHSKQVRHSFFWESKVTGNITEYTPGILRFNIYSVHHARIRILFIKVFKVYRRTMYYPYPIIKPYLEEYKLIVTQEYAYLNLQRGIIIIAIGLTMLSSYAVALTTYIAYRIGKR